MESIEDWIIRRARDAVNREKDEFCLSGTGVLKESDLIELTGLLKENYMRKIIMVDMDSTLTDSRWRNQFAPSNGGNWPDFHKRGIEDEPTILVPLVNILSRTYDICISTARPGYAVSDTQTWLKEHTDLGNCLIYHRSESESEIHLKSPELKERHMNQVGKQNIILAIDDRKDVCAMYESHGISILCPDFRNEHISLRPVNYDRNKKPAPFPKEPTPVKPKNPFTLLTQSAELFESRNEEYGDSYKSFGKLLKTLFPNGQTLNTEKDFSRFATFSMMMAKIHRYSMNFEEGHDDSLRDLRVYAAMQETLDS